MRPRVVGREECGDEVRVVLIVVGRTVRSAVPARPGRLKVESGDDLDTRLGAGFHDTVGFGPVETALAAALDLAPLEERFLPAEASVSDEFEVTAGGVRVAPQEQAPSVFLAPY